jgi:uncharacterized protein
LHTKSDAPARGAIRRATAPRRDSGTGTRKEAAVRFAVTGATGLVGGEMSRQLRAAGHEVMPVVRSFSDVGHGERAVVWQPDRGLIEAEGLEGVDVVIHLAGESLAGVWTPGKRRRIRDSRTQGTALLARTLAGLRRPPRALFSASGFNYYGDRADGEPIDEAAPPGTGFLAEVAQAWEAATQPAADAGIRVVITRFGNVLSPRGGLLGVLVPLFRLGLGAPLGSGRQIWPWIDLADIPRALLHVLERPEIAGPVNFVAPNPVTNEEFTAALAAALNRPVILRVPAFAAKLVPGDMFNELLFSGARVVPRKLEESGFPYLHRELRPALRAMLAADR